MGINKAQKDDIYYKEKATTDLRQEFIKPLPIDIPWTRYLQCLIHTQTVLCARTQAKDNNEMSSGCVPLPIYSRDTFPGFSLAFSVHTHTHECEDKSKGFCVCFLNGCARKRGGPPYHMQE